MSEREQRCKIRAALGSDASDGHVPCCPARSESAAADPTFLSALPIAAQLPIDVSAAAGGRCRCCRLLRSHRQL